MCSWYQSITLTEFLLQQNGGKNSTKTLSTNETRNHWASRVRGGRQSPPSSRCETPTWRWPTDTWPRVEAVTGDAAVQRLERLYEVLAGGLEVLPAAVPVELVATEARGWFWDQGEKGPPWGWGPHPPAKRQGAWEIWGSVAGYEQNGWTRSHFLEITDRGSLF